MDVVTDQLFDGRRFRVLTVVDKFSRECVLMEADFSLTGRKVAKTLEQAGQLKTAARGDYRGQWIGVCGTRPRQLGVLEGIKARLHLARKDCRKRLHRVV